MSLELEEPCISTMLLVFYPIHVLFPVVARENLRRVSPRFRQFSSFYISFSLAPCDIAGNLVLTTGLKT